MSTSRTIALGLLVYLAVLSWEDFLFVSIWLLYNE